MDTDRFTVETTQRRPSSDSDDEDGNESEDSMFERQPQSVTIADLKNGRTLKIGSRIKLKITEVQVSEGTLILQGVLH